MKSYHYACAADNNYVVPLEVLLSSAIWAHRGEVGRASTLSFHVLDVGIQPSTRDRLEQRVRDFAILLRVQIELTFHTIEKEVFEGLPRWHSSIAPYARLLLPRLLKEVDWCCYMDCDTLFIEDPVKVFEHKNDQFALLGHKNPIESDEVDRRWFASTGGGEF